MSDSATTAKPGRTRRLDCPNCGGSVEVRANGISVSAICASCGATIDVADNAELRVIAEARQRTHEPLIAIGTRGMLSAIEWEVIGYQERSNPDAGWRWEEYLLFNPYRGFRFLAHDDEGWTLFRMLRQDVPDPQHLEPGLSFGEPETSQARTDYVLGEFYWRVRIGDVAAVDQYKAGTSVLVKETSGEEIVWSKGVTLPADTVRNAFKLAPDPATARKAARRARTIAVLWTGAAACLLLLVLSAIGIGKSGSLPVLHEQLFVTTADRNKPLASAPFVVPDASGNLEIEAMAPVDNNWAEIEVALVEEGTNATFNASGTIEYYSGYDSDGSWTEGSRSMSILFRSIPGGTYRLLADVDSGVFGESSAPRPGAGLPLTIDARRHVPSPAFFWFAFLLIVSYPLYRLFWKRGSK